MTVLSHFITFTCFPSIIIYNKLPEWLVPKVHIDDDAKKAIDEDRVLIWMNCLNLAIFFCSMALGVFLSGCCLKRKKELHWGLCAIAIALETLSALYITLSLTEDWLFKNEVVSLVAIICLAFSHGVCSAYITTDWPPVSKLGYSL